MDIFNTIAARDAAPAKPTTRKVKGWHIHYVSNGAYRWSKKIYSYASARRIVARLKRRGNDAYQTIVNVTLVGDERLA